MTLKPEGHDPESQIRIYRPPAGKPKIQMRVARLIVIAAAIAAYGLTRPSEFRLTATPTKQTPTAAPTIPKREIKTPLGAALLNASATLSAQVFDLCVEEGSLSKTRPATLFAPNDSAMAKQVEQLSRPEARTLRRTWCQTHASSEPMFFGKFKNAQIRLVDGSSVDTSYSVTTGYRIGLATVQQADLASPTGNIWIVDRELRGVDAVASK
jgi:Fasciclin domain